MFWIVLNILKPICITFFNLVFGKFVDFGEFDYLVVVGGGGGGVGEGNLTLAFEVWYWMYLRSYVYLWGCGW